jgi:hypothetical protein
MRTKNHKRVTNNVLSPEDVGYIKYLIKQGCSDSGLSRMWGVSRTEIYWIRNNQRWWDVKPMDYADC